MGICRSQRNSLAGAALVGARSLLLAVLSAAGLVGLVGCSAQSLLSWEASDRQRPHYVVRGGDTLYSVAWGHGVDFRRLATVNNLHPPYPLKPGQVLRLPKGVKAMSSELVKAPAPKPIYAPPLPTRPATKPSKPSVKRPSTRPAPTPEKELVGIRVPNLGRWGWPNGGKLVKNWGARPKQVSGVDIAAKPGSGVNASADGVVVYTGDGLRKYGNLVIVKHSEALLSAYAYNKQVLVKKGQRIQAGERIALSGRSPDGVAVVHFEIRKYGKPVDALQYLKRRS